MPQEPFLFAASIRDNIAYGRDGGFRHSRDFILTECYSQFTVQSFSGILWSAKLSVVFYGDRDLWMLHNQFSKKFKAAVSRNRTSQLMVENN